MLPPSLRAAYRLFLRVSRAATLAQPPATRALRRLYRPVFRAAARNAHLLYRGRKSRPHWQTIWDNRLDGTLSFLTRAAASRGLPHALTLNLLRLRTTHLAWTRAAFYKTRGRWNPQSPPPAPSSPARASTSTNPAKQLREAKEARLARVNARGWGALGEVVSMAEARDGLFLGRVSSGRRKA
ncbi:hypothetical protein PLICRDRAFT_662045 [Plicaturopsis crispa FD-325 SS-3]|nr:hypothetical protein PLICRDRAFT_662045 [Plicaturopsis crispa FD-325 SS-3]